MQRNNIKLTTIDNDANVTSLKLIDNNFSISFNVDNLYNFRPLVDLKSITIEELKTMTLFELYYK